jgi:hypothetical protein
MEVTYMSLRTSLIGLGNRARSGKDTIADYLKNKYNNVFILHWADALKKEVINKESINLNAETGERLYPLIFKDDNYYNILDSLYAEGDYQHIRPVYLKFHPDEVPFLHDIFEKRGIKEYKGMEGNGYDEHKDGEMLQFWGTNFRRTFMSKNYWVNKTMESVKKIENENPDLEHIFILIPDTRFINELKTIKSYNPISYYCSVIRYNSDGSRYYDPTRDINHPSETELDLAGNDYQIEAVSGDINGLYYQADKMFEDILNKVATLKENIIIDKTT